MIDTMLLIKHNSAKMIKDIFSIIKSMVSEVEIICTPQGLKIASSDNGHVCFVYLDISSKFFDEYRMDEEEYSLKIDCENFVKTFSSPQAKNIVNISYENDGENKLFIEFKKDEKKKGRIVKLNLLDEILGQSPSSQVSLLEIEYQNIININPLILENAISANEIYGESMIFSVSHTPDDENIKEFSIKSVGSNGEAEDFIDEDDMKASEFKLEGEWDYTIKFLKNIIKSSKLSDSFILHLGIADSEDGVRLLPLRIDATNKELLSFHFFVAPRKKSVRNEDEDGEYDTENNDENDEEDENDEYKDDD